MEHDNIKEEFKSAEELHRFEATMMLGQTAVYLVATGALLNAVGGKEVSPFNRIVIAVLGMVLSLAFLQITRRCGLNLQGARKRAEELGRDLQFKLYSPDYRAPAGEFFVGKNVANIICGIGGLLWFVVLCGSWFS